MSTAARPILLLLALLTAAVRAGSEIDARAEWSATEPTTADRVTLTVTIRTDPACTVEPWRDAAARVLADAGWTEIASTATAPALDAAGRVERTVSFVLEPFLPGRYAHAPVTIAAVGPAGERRTVQLAIPEVTVRSLLPGDEPVQVPGMPTPDLGGDLALGTFRPVPEPPGPGPGGLAWALIAGFLAVAAVVFLVVRGVRRGIRRHDRSDPAAELNRIAPSVRTTDDLAPVDRIVRAAARRYNAWDRFADILDRLEHARYAPPGAGNNGGELDPSALAREAAHTVGRVAGAPGDAAGSGGGGR